ncbi:MAG: DegT/DnrJ/EryC1/StrS family aminotransferase [Opitutales bacterium]
MKVDLLNLKEQNEVFKERAGKVFAEVFESQHFIEGKHIAELEEKIAQYCGVKHAVGVSSGTDAILASLLSLGIARSPIDNTPAPEVIIPTFTFFATAGSVWRAGAKPVFVDIDADTFNLDPSKLEEAITENTKAIIPVHLYGQCANMSEIMSIAKKHNLYVIEDACQSIGSMLGDKKAGSLGDIGCFSFFPTKNLGAFGDAGMAICNDDEIAQKLRQVRNHAMQPRYFHKWVGGNYRLDTLQAGILSAKMDSLESWHEARIANAKFYVEQLSGIDGLKLPCIVEGARHVFNQFVICTDKRDALMQHLRANEIACEIYYPVPLHLQECFEPLGYKEGDFPVAEATAKSCLAIPVYAELLSEQRQFVVDTIRNFYL